MANAEVARSAVAARSALVLARESGSEPYSRSNLKAQAGALPVRLADDETRPPRRHRPARLLVGEGTSEQRGRGGQVRTLAFWESRSGVRDGVLDLRA
jgi:hypothetical protein